MLSSGLTKRSDGMIAHRTPHQVLANPPPSRDGTVFKEMFTHAGVVVKAVGGARGGRGQRGAPRLAGVECQETILS